MNEKMSIRNSVARLLSKIGLTSPALRGYGKLSVATFHRVLPEAERQAYPFPGLAVTPEELDIFLIYLTQHFDCGSLSTQHKRYLSGEVMERPLLAITFDDAQHDNYSNARPVLVRHGVKASFFVPVKAVEKQELLWHDSLGFSILALLKQGEAGQQRLGQLLAEAGMPAIDGGNVTGKIVQAAKVLTLEARLRMVEALVAASAPAKAPDFARLMTFEELAELAGDGHEIGSHSMTHCMMPECDDEALAYEVAESRRILQARLGQPIDSFCYPNGNSDTRTALAVAQAGYCRAITTAWGNNGQKEDAFRLRRYDMVAKHVQDANGKFVPALLAFRMSGFYPGL
jgi:peptidoglycan/xylan/chitin deacetylase (PgdA/CDA1 family)